MVEIICVEILEAVINCVLIVLTDIPVKFTVPPIWDPIVKVLINAEPAPSKLVLRLVTNAKLVEMVNVEILDAVIKFVLIVWAEIFEAVMPPPI